MSLTASSYTIYASISDSPGTGGLHSAGLVVTAATFVTLGSDGELLGASGDPASVRSVSYDVQVGDGRQDIESALVAAIIAQILSVYSITLKPKDVVWI